MSLTIPYDAIELRLALMNIPEDLLDEEKTREVREGFEKRLPKNQSEKNKLVAAAHGITVLDLINSPNYKILVEDYAHGILRDLVGILKEKFGATDVQAWALIAVSIGLIK